MNLSALLPTLRALPDYDDLRQRAGRDPIALGLPRAARLPFVAALAADLNRPTLIITARSDRALLFNEELPAWMPIPNTEYSIPNIQFFPEPNPLPYEHAPWGPHTIQQRIATLAALAAPSSPLSPPSTIITSARALMTRTLPKRDFAAATRTLKVGQSIRLEKLLESWTGAGYGSESIVVEPGQFSRRGGIVDVWPPAESTPTRIELFGDEIEGLRRFDPSTQRSGEKVDAVTVTPAREALPKNGPAIAGAKQIASPLPAADLERLAQGVTFPAIEYYLPLLHPTTSSLLDYVPDETLIFVDDWEELADTIGELETQALELRNDAINNELITDDFPTPTLSWSDLQDDVSRRPLLHLGRMADEAIPAAHVHVGDHFAPGPRFGGQVKQVIDHLEARHTSGLTSIVVTRQSARLAELWNEDHDHLAPSDSLLPPLSSLHFIQGALADGFTLQLPTSNPSTSLSTSLQLLTDSEIFGWARPEPRRRRTSGVAPPLPETSYADFNPGDFVVHIDYGIGRYLGLVKRAIEGSEREYLHIQYEGGDDLFVPIIQADRLTKYVGSDEALPTLSRLGTSEWVNARARAQQAAEELARELLELYAKREVAPGRAFSADNPWQKELEASFGYIETEDQLKAIAAVKKDMEQSRPMDRLICGDVGYGKTEVALRAAFKAVNDGVQVAMLVPTTVLAQQHYNTFSRRLAAYPVRVEMLSRFRTHAEQEKIIEGLATGAVDIVIGTHRLLSQDVVFKELGLLIIDEEQRFGVTHKERLKKMRTEVDVLTLTATPIPRTLYMSLAGIRDISMINTPPDERLSIITHVGPYNERVARQAILRELDRGGQIFFVHNRVQSIGIVQRKLEKLTPEARIGVGHGQMHEHELERAMTAFTGGDVDILLCTSIIESGLDIPNANTLVVDRADMFGLAQLYQLRGRVGRGANRAYAYFFHDKHHRMTPDARQRLETIAEQTELGAGYSIAMRDLEMRGAGDLLGARQHGHIAAIGFHLYTRLLAQAVRQLKAEARLPGKDKLLDFDLSLTTIDLPIPASLPGDYIPDRGLRLKLYRRLAEIKDEKGIEEMTAELLDRFGPLPKQVESLLFLIRVKLLAYRAGVETVASEDGQITFRSRLWESDESRPPVIAALGTATRMSKGKAWLPRASDEARTNWREQLVRALESLEKVFAR